MGKTVQPSEVKGLRQIPSDIRCKVQKIGLFYYLLLLYVSILLSPSVYVEMEPKRDRTRNNPKCAMCMCERVHAR